MLCVSFTDRVGGGFDAVQAFDSWYSLVGEQNVELAQLSLEKTPNEELPPPLHIWMDLVDLLQVRTRCCCDASESIWELKVLFAF
jgi:hypothetical protein